MEHRSLASRWSSLTGRTRTLILSGVCFGLCFGIAMQNWMSLRFGGFDLSIFHEAVRSYAHFEWPRSEIKRVHHEFPPGFTLLGDHFSPIYALLAPLYWVWEDPRMLLLAQAALFAAGVPLVRRFALRTRPDLPEQYADLAALVFAIGWPLVSASRTGFHEVAFAVPLTLLMLERAQARSYGWMAVAAFGLCCTKEDLGLMVGVFGLVLLVRATTRRDRAWATGLLIGGPLMSAIAIKVVIPAMGGVSGYYWNYAGLGTGPRDAAVNVATHPWLLITAALDSPTKVMLLLFLFGGLAFLPLRSLTTLAVVPLLAERLYSDNSNHWVGGFHYDAFVWPILVIAAIEALPATVGNVRRVGTAAVSASVALCLASGAWTLLVPSKWQPSATKQALIDAAATIPDGASVEANNFIAPRLTPNHKTLLVDATPRCMDYVLVRTDGALAWPLEADEVEERIELLLAHGYVPVFDRDDALLLRRTPEADVPNCALPGPDSTPVQDTFDERRGWWIF